MSSIQVTTNFRDSNGADLGTKLVTKDYLISVYPEIGQQIGIPPELWIWGYGNDGELGNANTTNAPTPITTFAGGTNWKQVSSGGQHTAAIKTDGTLWVWGNTTLGGLGDGVTVNAKRSTPITTFAGGTNWKQVSAGGDHTAAIKTDGTLWVWGNNDRGKLGNASTTNVSTPVTTFAGGTNWKQVSVSFRHIGAIKTDGTLWTWGNAGYGRLGNGDTSIFITRSTPLTTFAGGNDWKQISCGSDHMAAIKTDGTLWIWGRGVQGRLGDATLSSKSTPVTTFAGGNDWKQVSAQSSHTAAIKTDGTLWIWGRGGDGRLGNSSTIDVSTPVTTFAGGNNWKQVSIVGSSTAAIKTDGTLWTWGSGSFGQLGNNITFSFRWTPITTFAGGNNWKQVSKTVAITYEDPVL